MRHRSYPSYPTLGELKSPSRHFDFFVSAALFILHDRMVWIAVRGGPQQRLGGHLRPTPWLTCMGPVGLSLGTVLRRTANKHTGREDLEVVRWFVDRSTVQGGCGNIHPTVSWVYTVCMWGALMHELHPRLADAELDRLTRTSSRRQLAL